MYVEVESNPNCGNSVFLRFRELGPARPVGQARVYDRVSTGEWCWVTGWQDDASAPRCPAGAQPGKAPGVGVVILGRGGNGGTRMNRLGRNRPGGLESLRQWAKPICSWRTAATCGSPTKWAELRRVAWEGDLLLGRF